MQRSNSNIIDYIHVQCRLHSWVCLGRLLRHFKDGDYWYELNKALHKTLQLNVMLCRYCSDTCSLKIVSAAFVM